MSPAPLQAHAPAVGTLVGNPHSPGKDFGFIFGGVCWKLRQSLTKSLKSQEKGASQGSCYEVVLGHLPAREMLPAGVSENRHSSKK